MVRALDTYGPAGHTAAVELADPRLLVEEVEVDCVCLVSQRPVQHLHGVMDTNMRRIWSERLPTRVGLPVVWSPRTRAGAAALMIGVGTRAGGVAALGCSCDTDPSKVLARCKEGLREVLSRSQRGLCGG